MENVGCQMFFSTTSSCPAGELEAWRLVLEACGLRLLIESRKARHFFTYEGGRSSSAIVKYLNSDRLELSLINQEPPYIALESAV